METVPLSQLLKLWTFSSCPSTKSLSGSPATKEKEIDRWPIGGKLTGVFLLDSASRIERLTNGCRSFANDSGSYTYLFSDSQSPLPRPRSFNVAVDTAPTYRIGQGSKRSSRTQIRRQKIRMNACRRPLLPGQRTCWRTSPSFMRFTISRKSSKSFRKSLGSVFGLLFRTTQE